MKPSDGRVPVRSWWAARWVREIERLGAGTPRLLQRAHALARRGAVHDLSITPGRLAGTVADGTRGDRQAEVSWAPPSDGAWRDGLARLRSEVRFTLSLLEHGLEPDVVDALEESGVALIPSMARATTRCTCRTSSDGWCAHGLAVVLAAALRADTAPDLLFDLAGRPAARVLAEVRGARGPVPERMATPTPVDPEAAVRALAAVELHPRRVPDPGRYLRHLGPPPGMDAVESLTVIVEQAAGVAWRLAAGDGAAVADEEVLLAELRAQRVADASALAAALGRDADDVRAQLDRLFEAGVVLRTGVDDRVRYRAAQA